MLYQSTLFASTTVILTHFAEGSQTQTNNFVSHTKIF